MADFPELYEKEKLDEMYAQLGLSEETLTLLWDYFSAFAEFYHILPLHDAYNIIKRQNGELISKEDFIGFAETVRHDDGFFYYVLGADELFDDEPVEFMDREIIHECLVDDIDDYICTLNSQRGKPLYIPEKEALLKYADDFYFAHTPQTDAMTEFFREKMGMTPERAEDFAADCVGSICCTVYPKEDPIKMTLSMIDFFKVKFTKLQKDEFIRLLAELSNNTRHCCNRGFTPNELADRYGISDKVTVAGISAEDSEKQFKPSEIGLVKLVDVRLCNGSKIGRNDPCPCGSGKKYKKCCGR